MSHHSSITWREAAWFGSMREARKNTCDFGLGVPKSDIELIGFLFQDR
ncbi:MAG: hypothetical protein LAO08_03205 [Acidobacteriia bacterium]|nr:hypothetical protein [Terriglobia bacterium]